ncbi:MAG: outer membrane beta-barrel protein [Cyclobacteriaceae bacterium]|nr:outer membrane beta-barrel protein [Cyclobacteriaceae bacterium]
MKNFLIALFFCLTAISFYANAQATNDILIGGGLDVVKTDNVKVFDKAQIGFEANYFIQRRFAIGAGLEIWTRQRNSFVMGVRWYANDNIFLRFRGLIGANDASFGAGYSKPIGKNWRFEALGDFFFDSQRFALRGGLSYVIRR